MVTSSNTSSTPSFDQKELFIFDMDGVLYRTNEPIPSGLETVRILRQLGKKVAFLTNNSTKTQEDFAQKLNDMGLDADPQDIFTSASITATALANQYSKAKVFVIGENGLRSALKSVGFEIVNEMDPDLNNLSAPHPSLKIDLVVMGMDTKVTYNKFRAAMIFILEGAKFYATNDDFNFPAPGTLWPGSGANVAFLTTALGQQPDKIFGKPHPDGLVTVLEHYKIPKEKAVLVGDRFNTDILGGNRAGMTTVCVETGINTREELPTTPKDQHPTYIYRELVEMIQEHFS